VLLQECRRGWLERICETAGLTGVRTHDVQPARTDLPADGCAIAVRAPWRIENAAPIPREMFDPHAIAEFSQERAPAGYDQIPGSLLARFAARSLLAEISDGSRRFVACSLQATPGTGHYGPRPGKLVGEWKPFFHAGAAAALNDLTLPFVCAIDANEPRSETLDAVTFHWADGRLGALKFATLLGLNPKHRGRDLLREQIVATGEAPASDTCLALTYRTHSGGVGGLRRFDSVWASPEFRCERISTHYEEALEVGTDHALLVAELTLQ
jgi:hypothetical protein